MNLAHNTLTACNLMDLGYYGNPFTVGVSPKSQYIFIVFALGV
jgi:hypothetical protein